MLNLRTLEKLVVLAEEANFSRAAARLGLSQPVLSRSIAQLEEVYGLRLFDRSRAGVVPTSVGAELLVHARRLLGEADNIEQNLILQSRGEAGKVAFGIGPLAANFRLADLLAACIGRWPDLSVTTQIGATDSLVERLLDAELDFCICSANTLAFNSALTIRQLCQIEMGYFVRKEHPLAKCEELADWAQMRQFPRVTSHSSAHPSERPDHLFGPFEATLECDDFDVLRKVVLDTDAIWLTSARLSPAEIAAGELVEITPPGKRSGVLADIVLVRVGSRSPSRAAQQIIDTATGIFA